VVARLERVKGGRVRLEVEDEGEGIPKGSREKAFEMFWTTRPQGTGLGLFLARAAVEKCGGRLEAVEPRGGRGACLRMELPEFVNAEAQRRGEKDLPGDKEKTVS
jgi:signal transduction histidine kinase